MTAQTERSCMSKSPELGEKDRMGNFQVMCWVFMVYEAVERQLPKGVSITVSGAGVSLSPILLVSLLLWPVSYRSWNPVVSPRSPAPFSQRFFIIVFPSLFPRCCCEQKAKHLHTTNEPGVTDPNLGLTPSRMFPLRIFISSEDMCGQSMLFSDL